MGHATVKRVYLIHCFQGQLPWHRKLVETFSCCGAEAVVLGMPTPRDPTLSAWLEWMQRHIKPPWHEVGLIGHSIGAAAVLYFIRQYVRDANLGGTALIAAGSKFNLPGFSDQIKTFEFVPHTMTGMWTGPVLMVNGEKDKHAYPNDPQIIARELSAKLVIVPGAGHFGIADPRERNDLPAAVKEAILNHFGYFPKWP